MKRIIPCVTAPLLRPSGDAQCTSQICTPPSTIIGFPGKTTFPPKNLDVQGILILSEKKTKQNMFHKNIL